MFKPIVVGPMSLYGHLLHLAQTAPSSLTLPHTQTPLQLKARPPFPDIYANATQSTENEPPSHTLLAALAPAGVACRLRPAFGNVERLRLSLSPPVLSVEYALLGLARKKKFSVDQLRGLIDAPHAERDAWTALTNLDALAPLIAYVGRRMNCEVEVVAPSGKTHKFEDLKTKRPGRLVVTVHPGGTLSFSRHS